MLIKENLHKIKIIKILPVYSLIFFTKRNCLFKMFQEESSNEILLRKYIRMRINKIINRNLK